MFSPARRSASRALCSSQSVCIPDFLAPALANGLASRHFSSFTAQQSRIGAAPISIPPDVKILTVEPLPTPQNTRLPRKRQFLVEGPLGRAYIQNIPSYLELNHNEQDRKVTLSVQDKNERKQREMWGTTRATLSNHILGVSEGHVAILRLVGVGYRATVESSASTKEAAYPGQMFVNLKVGYSHPIELGVPSGVKASVPQPSRIMLEGVDKEVVNQFAAEIRAWRKPEPYKGKGIFVNDETIKLKAKKIK